MPQPRFLDDPSFRCLRVGDAEGFRKHTSDARQVDFSDTDLRGVDLRAIDLKNVVIRGAYLRDADLRGIDLRDVDLEGCSLYHAKVSGTYFSANIPAEEIVASIHYGIRIRTRG